MALHHNVLVEHSFATFFLQAILNRRTTIQGAVAVSARTITSLTHMLILSNSAIQTFPPSPPNWRLP
jgi:hypothetical protein